jgi:hypothetical protein
MHVEHLPTRRQLLAPVALLLMGCCLAFGAGLASANHVSCGERITADTTLDRDLVNCPNHGIVIAADGVTLDLNGHLVDGDGTPAADCDPQKEPCDFGLFNDGHDGVTVKDGSVREFASGVLFGTASGRARHNRVLSVSATRNQFAGLGIFSQVRAWCETAQEMARWTVRGAGCSWPMRITSGS